MKKMKFYCYVILLSVLLFFPSKHLPVSAITYGNITIELKEIEDESTQIKDIGFHLYKVGYINKNNKPELDEIYNIVKYPENAEEIEKTCTKIMKELTEKELMSGKTDDTGHLTFHPINTGVYLIVADKENKYGQIQPSLIDRKSVV